jgi:oxidase EvaA
MTAALPIAERVTDLRQFLDTSKIGFAVEEAKFGPNNPWQIRDGAIVHPSGGFFSVVGVKHADGQSAVMLYQPQSAQTGIITSTINGKRCYLLQARPEPGTFGSSQYGPTVQATPANYLRMHGGRATPYVDYFSIYRSDTTPFADTTQLDLGRRYFQKSKRLMSVECTGTLPVVRNYVWATAEAVLDSLRQSAFFNIDLRSFFATLPWLEELGLLPRDPRVQSSASATLRPEVIGAVYAKLRYAIPHAQFVPLESLTNWRITERGVFEIETHQGFNVEMYRVCAPGREVESWVQPLVNSKGRGLAVLYARMNGTGGFEVFIRASAEAGFQTGCALVPSVLRYPGETQVDDVELDAALACVEQETLITTEESDEGGRFYNDDSEYQVRLIKSAAPATGPNAFWVSVAELKHFLESSNLCSIQLRGLASLLLGSVDD